MSLGTLRLVGVALALVVVGCAGGGGEGGGGPTTDDSAEVVAGDAITLHNWQNHPKVRAVRAEVESIDKLGLKVEVKKMCTEGGPGESLRQKGVDAEGRIRTLVLQGGSEDSATTSRYYYDAAGKPRFLFQTRNDVHGNAEDQRVYFDETGARFWDVERHASDPDNQKPDLSKSPFAVPQPATDVHPTVVDPAAIFASPPSCG